MMRPLTLVVLLCVGVFVTVSCGRVYNSFAIRRCQQRCKGAQICPKPVAANTTECRRNCRTDSDCKSGDRCCWADCGAKQCIKAIENYSKRQYVYCVDMCRQGYDKIAYPQCPIVQSTKIRCYDECMDDGQCIKGLKCCKAGCGRTCVIPEGHMCVSNGKVYHEGEDVPQSKNNWCSCNNGLITCQRRVQHRLSSG